MRCPYCDNDDFAFTEETKRASIIDKILCFLGITGGVVILLYAPAKFKFIGLILIAVSIISKIIYSYFTQRTSRTKAICKRCFHWMYINEFDDDWELQEKISEWHKEKNKRTN